MTSTATGEPIVLGFSGSTYVHIVRLILTHKDVPYLFRDLEPEMGSTTHLALHPFNRVPIFQHGDLTLTRPALLRPYRRSIQGCTVAASVATRQGAYAPVDQLAQFLRLPLHRLSLAHERLVFPRLGITSDEKVVAHALPKVDLALQVMNQSLEAGGPFLLGPELSLADFFFVPCTYSLSLTDEGKASIPSIRHFAVGARRWKHYRACSASAQHSRRVARSSTRANGPSGTGRSIELSNTRQRRPCKPSIKH